jgi:hypothetical protein
MVEDVTAGLIDPEGFPWRFATGKNRRCVKLDIFEVHVAGRGDLIHLAAEPLDLRLIDTDSSQHEIFFGRIPGDPASSR